MALNKVKAVQLTVCCVISKFCTVSVERRQCGRVNSRPPRRGCGIIRGAYNNYDEKRYLRSVATRHSHVQHCRALGSACSGMLDYLSG